MWLKEDRFDLGGKRGLTSKLEGMRPRLSAVWHYGSRNGDQVARRAAVRVESFIETGDFRRLEGSLRLERILPCSV